MLHIQINKLYIYIYIYIYILTLRSEQCLLSTDDSMPVTNGNGMPKTMMMNFSMHEDVVLLNMTRNDNISPDAPVFVARNGNVTLLPATPGQVSRHVGILTSVLIIKEYNY